MSENSQNDGESCSGRVLGMPLAVPSIRPVLGTTGEQEEYRAARAAFRPDDPASNARLLRAAMALIAATGIG